MSLQTADYRGAIDQMAINGLITYCRACGHGRHKPAECTFVFKGTDTGGRREVAEDCYCDADYGFSERWD
jgi:hypothetical protein